MFSLLALSLTLLQDASDFSSCHADYENYWATVRVDPVIASYPEVYDTLGICSDEEFEEGRTRGGDEALNWQVMWDALSDETPLLSLIRGHLLWGETSEFQFGVTTFIWDIERRSVVQLADLFEPAQREHALRSILTHAERDAQIQISSHGGDEVSGFWETNHHWPTRTTLLPSTQDASLGGLALWYSDTELGISSNTGTVLLIVPQAAFADYLIADYKPVFAGEPRPHPEFADRMCDSTALVGCPETE